MSEGGLRLVWMDPEELEDNPFQWRQHPPAQHRALLAALSETGWAGAAIYNETTGHLIDGHLRKRVAIERGETIPVLVGSWSETDERLILAMLDPLVGMAITDTSALDALLKSVETESAQLQALFDEIGDFEGFPIVKVPVEEQWFESREERKIFRMIMVPLSRLRPNNYSVYAMTKQELALLKTSIQEVGLAQPLVCRLLEDGLLEIIDGMQRYKAAKELGLEEVPVRVYEDMGDVDAKLMHLALNAISGKLISSRAVKVFGEIRDVEGDEAGTQRINRVTGHPKNVIRKLPGSGGYEHTLDEDGIPQRQYRQFGPDDYESIGDVILLSIPLDPEDYALIEEVLGSIHDDWTVALMEMVKAWQRNSTSEN